MLRPLMAGHARRAQQLLAHPASRQLIRYVIAGLLVTQFSAFIYLKLALQGIPPYFANVVSTGCGMIAGYTIHSRWSFKGGRKDSETFQVGRFLIAAAIAFSMNTFWIWLTVHQLGLPTYAPVPLMMAATPILSFLLNRYWVFRAH